MHVLVCVATPPVHTIHPQTVGYVLLAPCDDFRTSTPQPAAAPHTYPSKIHRECDLGNDILECLCMQHCHILHVVRVRLVPVHVDCNVSPRSATVPSLNSSQLARLDIKCANMDTTDMAYATPLLSPHTCSPHPGTPARSKT